MKTFLIILSLGLLLTGCSKKLPPASKAVELATNSASAQPMPLPNLGSAVNAGQAAAPVDMTQTIRRYGTPVSYFDQITRFPAWKTVPRGAQVFDNVPIQIDGMICLWGEDNADRLKIVFPEQATGIPVKKAFETLYVYHGAFYASTEGTPVFAVVFRYADGSSATNQLLYGEDVINWLANTDGPIIGPSGPRSKLAWVAAEVNRRRSPVRESTFAAAIAKIIQVPFQELIWPSRRIWTGLTAGWILLAMFNLSQHKVARTNLAKSQTTAETMMTFRDQQKILNDLFADRLLPVEAMRPRIFSPKPRTETTQLSAA